jgi:conjugative relaxase-like TrwC/TraI family protein
VAGHATSRYVDAHEWVVASFLQHTSRDGDPQLHVHNAILNRAPCADGEWRTIDSRGLHRARAAAAAVGGRVMDEQVARVLGAAYAQRPDGHARELTGVPQAVKDKFSTRRAAITDGVADLAAQYQARHGRAPSARALFSPRKTWGDRGRFSVVSPTAVWARRPAAAQPPPLARNDHHNAHGNGRRAVFGWMLNARGC